MFFCCSTASFYPLFFPGLALVLASNNSIAGLQKFSSDETNTWHTLHYIHTYTIFHKRIIYPGPGKHTKGHTQKIYISIPAPA